MAAITLQRCLHHGEREAIARCPECGQFFCRECITEHEERVICASCLAKITRPAAPRVRRFRLAALRPWAAAFSGVIVAWLVFYCLGRILLALPSESHARTIWKKSFFNSWDDSDE